MRKILACFLVLLILAGTLCINAFAAETPTAQEQTRLSFGEVDGLELVYIPSEHSGEDFSYVVGDWYFDADSSFVNFGIMSDGVFTPLSDAYGSTVNDETLSAFVELFKNGKAGTELESWEVGFFGTTNDGPCASGNNGPTSENGTEPSETVSESQTVSETQPTEPNEGAANFVRFYPNSAAETDSAWFAFTRDDGEEGEWLRGKKSSDGSYYDFDALHSYVTFVKMPSDEQTYDFSKITAQTYDMAVNGSIFEVTGWQDKFLIGNWQQYATETESYYLPTEPWETSSDSEGNTVQPTGYTVKPTEPESTKPIEHPTGIHFETDPVETESPSEETTDKKTDEHGTVNNVCKLNVKTATVKCGRVITLTVLNKGKKKVTFTSKNPSVAKVGKTSGRVCALKKGSTYIVAKVGKKKLKFTIKVVTSPKLKKNSIKLKKGRTVSVKIVGKCPLVKNKYKSTKYAAIVSKTTADVVKVKGLKKGRTTLRLRVNGCLLKLKVKVT